MNLAPMRLRATKAAAQAKSDPLRFERADGSHCSVDMPRQGVLTHDLVHWVVESGLRLPGGFLSLIAAGAQASFAMSAAHDPQHAETPHQALHAEALVEALQTQLWAGIFDDAAFVYGAQMAAEARGIPVWPGLRQGQGQPLFEHAQALQSRWLATPQGESLILEFEPPSI